MDTRELTAGEERSLERIATLRAEIGRLRGVIRKAHRLLLEYEHRAPKPGYPLEVLALLSGAVTPPVALRKAPGDAIAEYAARVMDVP